jgi:glycerol uptake facilitator-like aquaporin
MVTGIGELVLILLLLGGTSAGGINPAFALGANVAVRIAPTAGFWLYSVRAAPPPLASPPSP